ncbi:cation diffusion facilitator family transporter [Hornefia butyriciproducens]|uniref:cation diffusion facilitator family transporter n=1 Tax=Hornefia butyriciproducens TaxID=2652293 RepID=UPI0023F11C4E|nr:cation diffusion facilitator family transporter [Hornefia butyriciproducens]MDD6299019.1 cation diffusion facilitator family transporter [Hornefia butyriciproducens]MDD7019610.1 cation diffusion facilitator family transporter [Hornefia butyriciproducens]MDY5422708.1 cation diffusion facilitator family transporter [Hornefia butyriciproducens]
MGNSENKVPQNLMEKKEDRDRIIVRTSVIGILANVFLAAFKAAAGIMSNSIAILLDAVNNLSDALSSVITIVGTKLASKAPDKKHPLGYGRIEYLSAMIVSAIVLYAGITSAVESVRKIIHPVKAEYTMVSLIIIVVAVLVKLILGSYVKKKGKDAKSGALTASGADAQFDAVLSLSVLLSALLYIATGVSLEAWVGAVISAVIIKAGVEMMIDTLNDILGKRADPETTVRIKRLLSEEPEVRGAYDLFLNNYGPDKNYGSVHLELPDTMTVEEVDVLTRRVQEKIYAETGVILTGVGVYSYNTGDNEAAEIRNRVMETVMSHDWALQLHGFFVDMENKEMRFDVVMSFEIDRQEGVEVLTEEIRKLYPDFHVSIVSDVDISD